MPCPLRSLFVGNWPTEVLCLVGSSGCLSGFFGLCLGLRLRSQSPSTARPDRSAEASRCSAAALCCRCLESPSPTYGGLTLTGAIFALELPHCLAPQISPHQSRAALATRESLTHVVMTMDLVCGWLCQAAWSYHIVARALLSALSPRRRRAAIL